MTLFNKRKDETISSSNISPKPINEEIKEEKHVVAICVKCIHHKLEEDEHKCYANAEVEVDYVTGEETKVPDDCSDCNDDGTCSYYEDE